MLLHQILINKEKINKYYCHIGKIISFSRRAKKFHISLKQIRRQIKQSIFKPVEIMIRFMYA